MKENETLKINPLPSKTWYWLRMNDTTVKWDGDVQPCKITSEEAGNTSENVINIEEMTSAVGHSLKNLATGAGNEADVIFDNEQLPVLHFKAEAKDGERIIRLDISCDDKENAAGMVYVAAEENAKVTVIEKFTPGKNPQSSLAFRTKLYAKKNSTIRLVQINMLDEGQRLVNDVGSVCDETAKIDVLQMLIGQGDVYNGVRTELEGDASELHTEIGYIGQKNQTLDMNLVVNHWGKKTNCDIQVDGTLKDAAKKVFRGSIDFKRGSSGSKGAETENVLLLGDDVVNQTIPLILCAEEDVDGSHGATIGELDEETLFYFAARGIDQETAEDIMTKAKLEVLYHHIQDEETERIVADQLTKVMSNDSQ